jgi:histidinol phosphatase-like PHP family hydrolase
VNDHAGRDGEPTPSPFSLGVHLRADLMASAVIESQPRPLSNAAISELLCLASEDRARSDQQRRALRRAGRAAWRWPVEATELLHTDRSLTELRLVGPWLARIIAEWIANPPVVPEPPAIRRPFLTRVEVDRILRDTAQRLPIGGDLQVHTLGSDGADSVAAMADAARERGLRYLAITDHSHGLAIAHGMNEAQLARQGDHIRALTGAYAQTGFRILRAVEMNLSPSGAGDLDPRFLATLDLVLGAFHSRLRVAEDQTERYLRALRTSAFHILAHPRGRIFNHRPGLRADWRTVFECARERDRAVEIDGYPDRQDLDVELLEVARETGARISLGSDAHASSQLEFLDFAVAAARRAGIPDDRIVNCMTADELLAWTRRLNREGI